MAFAELPDSVDCMMKLRAVSCHAGLASPSVNGTPLAFAMRAFDAPGPTRRLSESHAEARAASAHSRVILSIGLIGHLLFVACPHDNQPGLPVDGPSLSRVRHHAVTIVSPRAVTALIVPVTGRSAAALSRRDRSRRTRRGVLDRKSTRLNSSHGYISYA